jgi:DNA-binding transcriptional LysR family regulator
MLTLKQVEALVWIARMGSFEKAANKLNLTQSTISKRVQELEAMVGVAVFDRNGRDSVLTPKGEQLLLLGEKMLELRGEAMDLKNISGVPSRTLRLGVTELTALTWLPRLITEARRQYPNVEFDVSVDMTRDLHQGLADGVFEMVLVPEAFQPADTAVVRLGEVQNAWVASPLLVGRAASITYETLAQMTIISQGRMSGTGLVISRWLRKNGIELPNEMTCDSLVAQLGLTIAGLGATYIPIRCHEPLLAEGKLVVLDLKPELPSVPYAAMFRSDQPSHFTLELAEFARTLCDFDRQFQSSYVQVAVATSSCSN